MIYFSILTIQLGLMLLCIVEPRLKTRHHKSVLHYIVCAILSRNFEYVHLYSPETAAWHKQGE